MSFADKLKLLRQEKGWIQAELAKKINIHREQICKYERGQVMPNTEILVQLAKVFQVSLDYLVFEDEGSSLMTGKLSDRELLRQFELLDKMNEKDRTLVKDLIELAIAKNQIADIVLNLGKEKNTEQQNGEIKQAVNM